MLKHVELLQTFGPDAGQINGCPGHPEIELALLSYTPEQAIQKHMN